MLGLIITGLENSGTTITQKLLGNLKGYKIGTAPNLHCGAECGLLGFDSVDSYLATEHYPKWLKKGVELESLEEFNGLSFKDFYKKLSKVGKFNKKSGKIIDKTPMYLGKIEKVVENAPNVPVVIVRKNPYMAIASLIKRNVTLERAIELYSTYNQKKLVWCEKNLVHGKGCYIMDYSNLIADPKTEIEKIATWLGTSMPDDFDYSFVIQPQHYTKTLNPEQIETIKKAFGLKK